MLKVMFTLSLIGMPGENDTPSTDAVVYESLLKEFPGKPGDYSNNHKDRGRVAAAKFFAFVRDHRDSPEAVEALGWVASHCLFSVEAGEAMDRIANDYVGSSKLAAILCRVDMMYGDPFEANEAMLRVIRRGSPHPDVRGAAAVCLAHELSAKRAKAERDATQFRLFEKGENVPFATRPTATIADLSRWTDEATALCESVAEDSSYPAQCRVDAGATLRELRDLGVGHLAPEIEGRDHEGKLFKLSDYRGKVVVLTFATSTCAPCKAMYPLQRDLIARLRGQPFALVSVYADPEIDRLKKSVQSSEITWRSWCDGGADGPISRRWNVSSYPTIFVIDGAGVIRHKNVLGVGLEATVDALLGEAEGDTRR